MKSFCKIILPIKKNFADLIISGEKKYEFRKTIPKNPISTIYIYETAPVSKVIGEFSVGEILNFEKNELWDMTKDFSGISEKYFKEYFERSSKGYAIEVLEPIRYSNPILLEKLGLNSPPQSFVYIKS